MRFAPVRKEAAVNARLAGPIILAQMAQVAMGFTDTIMAGRLGAGDLGAIAIGVNLWVLPYLFCVGLLMAVSSLVAHAYGAARFGDIRDLMGQLLWVCLALALLAVAAIFAMAQLLPLLQMDAALTALAVKYVKAVAWGMPAVIGYLALRFMSEGMGCTRPMMVIQLLGLLANVLADWVFMFGKLGFPALGAEGAGWATALVMWLTLFLLLGYMAGHGRYRVIRRAPRQPREWQRTRELLRIGAPIAVTLLAEMGMFAAVALLMGRLGVVEVAAHQVAINVASLAFMIPLGISAATTVRVGHAVGEGRAWLVRFRGLAGIGLAAGCMLVTASVLFLFPRAIVAIYTGDAQVQMLAARLLLMAALFQLSDGIQISANGALRGIKDTFFPMLLTLAIYWGFGLPLSWYLAFEAAAGPQGLWAGLVAALTLAALLLVWRFLFLSAAVSRAASVPASG